MAAGTLLGDGHSVCPQAATTRKVADCCLHYWYQAAERGLGMCFLVLGPEAQIPTPTPHSILSHKWCTNEHSALQQLLAADSSLLAQVALARQPLSGRASQHSQHSTTQHGMVQYKAQHMTAQDGTKRHGTNGTTRHGTAQFPSRCIP